MPGDEAIAFLRRGRCGNRCGCVGNRCDFVAAFSRRTARAFSAQASDLTKQDRFDESVAGFRFMFL
jgi:hypothetical protein